MKQEDHPPNINASVRHTELLRVLTLLDLTSHMTLRHLYHEQFLYFACGLLKAQQVPAIRLSYRFMKPSEERSQWDFKAA